MNCRNKDKNMEWKKEEEGRENSHQDENGFNHTFHVMG